MTLLTAGDEMWNCNNPRPHPVVKYNACQWNESDMIKINGEWHS